MSRLAATLLDVPVYNREATPCPYYSGGYEHLLSLYPSSPPHAAHDEDDQGFHALPAVVRPPTPDLPQLEPCSLWQGGQVFEGSQRLSGCQRYLGGDAWQLSLHVHDVDWRKGSACGTMEASTSASATGSAVQTYWEAQLIDNANHTFWTRAWGACLAADVDHWARLPGWEAGLHADAVRYNGRSPLLAESRYLYMRLKERHFTAASPPEPSLTISGFYYLALDRQTGVITGHYFDQTSSCFELSLTLKEAPGGGGFCFPSYQLA